MIGCIDVLQVVHCYLNQDKINKGFMDCSAITIQKPDGTEKVLPSTKITLKGWAACLREQVHGGVQ